MGEAIFHLPDVGEGLVEAEIVEWKVAVGDVVTLNQPLVDIETAKATVELPSPYAGTVVTLHGAVGDVIEVDVVVDTAPRIVVEPKDLTAALRRDPGARAAYDRLSNSRRRELVRSIESAKRPETRARRVDLVVSRLSAIETG